MRNNTPDTAEIRWEILKSMLDDFPQLWNRTERYLLSKKDPALADSANPNDSEIEELVQKAINEYRKERLRK